MTLGDYLKTYPKNKTVAIAPVKGTGFMYIGAAGDTGTINLVFEDLIEQARIKYKEYQRRAEMACVVTGYDYRRNVSAATKWKTYIQTAIPLLDREVLSTCHKDVDNALCVKVEGNESGKFWLKSEFDDYSRNLQGVL